MKIFARLYQQGPKLTLFTRANCSLCETAKRTIEDVRKKHSVYYEEIDVLAKGNEHWKVFEFDTPVLHIEKFESSKPTATTNHWRLLHRFSAAEIEERILETS